MRVENAPITFVTTCNNRSLLKQNLLESACVHVSRADQIIIQEGFVSAALAYNDAIDRATTDIIVFAHQDVYFPDSWLADLDHALSRLADTDPNWGALGCYGIRQNGEGFGYLHSEGHGILGKQFDSPIPIDTLDEFVLILRKSSGLRFDATLPHFHFYGTDICLAARKQGLRSYAISAFCVHNTQPYWSLPPEFYECYAHIKERYREYLPIRTPCIRVTKWNEEVYRRQLLSWYRRLFKKAPVFRRLDDPRSIAAPEDIRQSSRPQTTSNLVAANGDAEDRVASYESTHERR
jgi:glycosyltransferase involved in cell wall biosynthesis